MNASLKALYDRFIAMGFVPAADNNKFLLYNKSGPVIGRYNSIYFETDDIRTNLDTNTKLHIIEQLESEIMEAFKNGPFSGYERYRIRLNNWNIYNKFIIAYMSCPTLNLPLDKHCLCYNMLTRECITGPEEFASLDSLLDKYGKFEKITYRDKQAEVRQKLKAAGFERISEHSYVHPKYPADNKYDNVMNIIGSGIFAIACCGEMYFDIMRLFISEAVCIAESVLQDYKKYGIKMSKWSLDRGCLVCELHCDGMRLFNHGEIIYSPFGDTQVLYIEGSRYPDLNFYLFSSEEKMREIMDTLASQFKQMATQIESLTKPNPAPN